MSPKVTKNKTKTKMGWILINTVWNILEVKYLKIFENFSINMHSTVQNLRSTNPGSQSPALVVVIKIVLRCSKKRQYRGGLCDSSICTSKTFLPVPTNLQSERNNPWFTPLFDISQQLQWIAARR